jgi:hypothetical protein
MPRSSASSRSARNTSAVKPPASGKTGSAIGKTGSGGGKMATMSVAQILEHVRLSRAVQALAAAGPAAPGAMGQAAGPAAGPTAGQPTKSPPSGSPPSGRVLPRRTTRRRAPASPRGPAASAGGHHEPGVLATDLGTVAPIGPAVIELLTLAYRADIPALLIGCHGVGKSEIVAAAAEAIGIDCISRDLSLMEPPDLVGLPKIVEKNGHPATAFLAPEFLPRDTGRGGFLLIEEVNRAPRYMQACCLELLTRRALNSYLLPNGWTPICCINPKADGYAVDLLDAALMSRFMQITVCASVESWIAWAATNGIHPKVIEYVSSVPNALDEQQGGTNPRSWTYASRTLAAAGADLLERSPDTIVTALNGLIGPVHTTALLRLIYGTEVALRPADLFHDWPAAKATMKRWLEQGRLDLLATSMRAVLQWLRPDGVAEQLRGNAGQQFAIQSFISLLPGDLADQARACLLELGHVHLIPDRLERMSSRA